MGYQFKWYEGDGMLSLTVSTSKQMEVSQIFEDVFALSDFIDEAKSYLEKYDEHNRLE